MDEKVFTVLIPTNTQNGRHREWRSVNCRWCCQSAWLHQFDIRWSGSKSHWSILSWYASITTLACCHESGVWRVHPSARLCPTAQVTLVFWHEYFTKSQGIATKHLRYGWLFNDYITENLQLTVPMKENFNALIFDEVKTKTSFFYILTHNVGLHSNKLYTLWGIKNTPNYFRA